jgi:hypothetical protein
MLSAYSSCLIDRYAERVDGFSKKVKKGRKNKKDTTINKSYIVQTPYPFSLHTFAQHLKHNVPALPLT